VSTIAYLFSGDDLQPSDLDLVCKAIFGQVLALTPGAKFDLRSGGVLLWTFSYRTSAVERTLVGKYPSVSHTLTDDKALRSALAVAFAKSVAAQYHHIDTEALSSTLLRQKVECVTASELSLECSNAIHRELLNQCPGYLGCFEVDKGDPLALQLAANGLIPFCIYADRTLKWLIPFDDLPAQQAPLSWPEGLGFAVVEFSTDAPDHIGLSALSPIGEENARLLKTRAQPQHAERVLSALRDRLDEEKGGTAVQVRFGQSEFGAARADVRKLRDYSLNEEHETGKHKAHVFRKLLGITAVDWSFLAEQLVAGLANELVRRPAKSQWGVQYHVVVPVVGRNGQTKLVKSAWIIRAGEPPSLVSAYVAEKADTAEIASLATFVVNENEGAERCRRVYEIADAQGRKAAEEWTPTPMWVSGYVEPISEGACGSAWVKLTDGRSKFSRWLKKNKLCSDFSKGCIIFGKTTTQSLEREQKYCEAFAQVLRLNGIECEVKWRYD
jgi:uncharacterized protein DUF6883